MANIVQLVFGVYLHWLPVGGYRPGSIMHLVLPILILSLPHGGRVARLMRGSMIEVLGTNYIRTARSKGLGTRLILLRHALKPALLPVVSYLGPGLSYLLTGSLVVEQVFALPGIGKYFITAALNRDYGLVLGTTILYVFIILALNLDRRHPLRLARSQGEVPLMAGITGKDAVLTGYAGALAREAPKGRSLTQDALRRLFANKAALVSIFILIAIVLFAFVGPYVLPWPYDKIDWTAIRKPPDFAKGHYFGTDQNGRDMLARTLQGTQMSLIGGGRRDRRLGGDRRHLRRHRRAISAAGSTPS